MFEDRVDAGTQLAAALAVYAGDDVVVLGIPRGGVVVGYEVARRLDARLDVLVPRKLRAPSNPELAIGAVTEDGTVQLNARLVAYLDVPQRYLDAECARQRREIQRRVARYRGDAPFPTLTDRVVIVVDDGIATGSTIRAALASIRTHAPRAVVLAVPVAPPATISELARDADRVVCLATPEPFFAIGQFYRAFPQTSDAEVTRLLRLNRGESDRPATAPP
jgi:predicted phosphoribosyltransferase